MKIGFFITARLKSSRLEYKILLDLCGKTVLDRVIERCKKVNNIDGVVVCTSGNPQDSILYEYALKHRVRFFIGSEDDVLDRLLSAALYYGYDAFISITADNPLFSIYISDLIADWYRREEFDFIYTKGLPIGCGPYMLNTKALQIVNRIKKESNTEIWGPFINRPDFFRVGELVVANSPFKEEKRLTCDYPEDYELFRTLYGCFPEDATPDIHDVFQILREDPELWKINAKHTQAGLDANILAEINSQFDAKKAEAGEYADSIGKALRPGKMSRNVHI